MLRAICSKVLATEQTVLPLPALVRCLRGNYCTDTFQNEDKTEQRGKEYSHCRVTLLGRVGNKPKELERASGSTCVSFPLGVFQVQGTNWHNINVHQTNTKKWVLERIDKGDRLYVQGTMRYYVHKAKDSDVLFKSYVINADQVSLISRKIQRQQSEEYNSEDEESEAQEHQ